MAVTNYLWDQDNYLEEYDEVGTTTVTYTNELLRHGSITSQHRNTATSFFHYDAQGSTHQLTDESESITDTFSYDAWGNELSRTGTTVNSFCYIGEFGYYYDEETDSFYVRARVYQPAIARWTSTDPIGFIGGMNLFQYVSGNPISKVDPSGLKVVCCRCTIYSPDAPPVTYYRKALCLGVAPKACCKNECPPPLCGIRQVVSESTDIPQLTPTTTPRRKKAPKNPTPVGYGHYCGVGRRANCRENKCSKVCFSSNVPDYSFNPEPIDKLDALCELHDCCLGTVSEALKCHKECHKVLCPKVRAISCEEMYPNEVKNGLEKEYCNLMKKRFLDTFC